MGNLCLPWIFRRGMTRCRVRAENVLSFSARTPFCVRRRVACSYSRESKMSCGRLAASSRRQVDRNCSSEI